MKMPRPDNCLAWHITQILGRAYLLQLTDARGGEIGVPAQPLLLAGGDPGAERRDPQPPLLQRLPHAHRQLITLRTAAAQSQAAWHGRR